MYSFEVLFKYRGTDGKFSFFTYILREAAKKSSSTNGEAIKRGVGKGRTIKEKNLSFADMTNNIWLQFFRWSLTLLYEALNFKTALN